MLTGVILAGGKSKRMGGSHKALLPFMGEPLIQRQIRIMRRVCDEIIVVSNDPRPFLSVLEDSVRIITDFYPGKGPLSGMHASFKLATNLYLWVVSCDNPDLSDSAAEVMLTELQRSDHDAVIPFIQGKLLLLHGLYRKHCVNDVESLVLQGSHVNHLLSHIKWMQVTESEFQNYSVQPEFYSDINTYEEYTQFQLHHNHTFEHQTTE